MQQTEYLDNLDESQRKAVEYIEGPSLVIAGAGSGKTRVLTTKIAFLTAHGLKPWNILALTFTNKAAREMRERVAAIVGEEVAKYLVMGTFHSVFAKILRKEAPLLGYTSKFTIYDRTDSTSLVKNIVKGMGLDVKVYKPSIVLSKISQAKNNLILAEEYFNDPDILKRDDSDKVPEVGHIYMKYQQRLKASDAMDFDDLLVKMYILLTTHEEVRRKYVDRFNFVLVDEYQDTNRTQARILWLLTRERQMLCVVGDDAQSIYAFRGADIGNILNFTRIFPDARLFKLERNYRSTKSIVDAANSVIAHNRNRIPKDVYSLAGAGQKIEIYPTESDVEEAERVVKSVCKTNADNGVPYSEIAVLYRKNAQSRVIEEALRKSGVPYRVYGGLSFYERKEVKDAIAYFRMTVNPNDDEAFRRVVNYPARGIGNTTLEKLMSVATNNGISLWETVNTFAAKELGVSATTYGRISKFVAMINGFAAKAGELDAYALGNEILEESGVRTEIVTDTSDLSRKENLDELINALYDFVAQETETNGSAENATIENYLADVALLTDADKNDADKEKVSLMTIHSAKGLEFSAVCIVGLEEEIFPGHQAFFDSRELEEERRLFYVALTRAKEYCYISYARFRFSYGNVTESDPSRFVKELDSSCVHFNDRKSKGCYGQPRRSFGGFDDNRFTLQASPVFGRTAIRRENQESDGAQTLESAKTQAGDIIKVGTVVEHRRFGKGVVKRIMDAGDTAKVNIEFYDSGTKDLLLKFAPLAVLE
ncbi:MAG: 3'-5' exonuclease [Bacteroidaceae bacterium]|nr:exodeoxyribonuclease V subunit gamma [Prevotellaceae bacterium]MDY4760108.1 3'-5' exonuclease [Bacteroidaceae bacterium]